MEKVVKSVNALKYVYGELIAEDKSSKDASFSPKERQTYCNAIAEAMTSQSLRNSNDFSPLLEVSIEILLQSCGDDNADVRLNAEECLNKLIKGLYETHLTKVLVELYKEIKKNGNHRNLRAAVARFADLCFSIRPAKCRPYILNLLPCLCRISQREEESIHDCLASALEKIFGSLGTYASESEVQGLIASFLKNLSHHSVTVRRTAGLCLHAVVANSRKVTSVLFPLTNSVLDILAQRSSHRSTILGCLQSLRVVAPLFSRASRGEREPVITKILEASLLYSCHPDHTVITSALELLEQLFRTFPGNLHGVLVKPAMDPPSFLVESQDGARTQETDSDELNLVDVTSNQSEAATTSPLPSNLTSSSDVSIPVNSTLTFENDDVAHVTADAREDLSAEFPTEEVPPSPPQGSLDCPSPQLAADDAPRPLTSADMFRLKAAAPTDLGHFPIATLARLLCQRFLLSRNKRELLSDAEVRVSTKTLALSCFGEVVTMFPPLYCLAMSEDCDVMMCDVASYRDHPDPKLRGAALHVVALFVNSVASSESDDFEEWRAKVETDYPTSRFSSPADVTELVGMLRLGLVDESSTCIRQACSAASLCLRSLLGGKYSHLGLSLLDAVVALQSNSYWLLKVDLLELLATVNYRQMAYLSAVAPDSRDVIFAKESFQQKSLSVMLRCLGEDDGRIRKSAAETLLAVLPNFFPDSKLNRDAVLFEAAELCRHQLGDLLRGDSEDVTMSRGNDLAAGKSLLKTYRGFEGKPPVDSISDNLSFILSELTSLIARATSKHLFRGCILALRLLSARYPPCTYPVSWGLHFARADSPPSTDRSRSSSTIRQASSDGSTHDGQTMQQAGLVPIVMGLLRSSWLPLVVPTHCDAIALAGNLIAGAASHGFQIYGAETVDQSEKTKTSQSTNGSQPSWVGIHDHMIGVYARELFTHLIKQLSICHHVISETSPTSLNKSVLPNLTTNASIPSPMKRRNKDAGNDAGKTSPTTTRKLLPSPLPKSSSGREDTEKDKQAKKSLGAFHQSRVLMKLYELLGGAYKNYKSSLEFGEGDRLCSFVASVLDVSCQILEVATFQDIGSFTEEILGYLKTTFAVQPAVTVQCVQQLLKSLFGTNLLSRLQLIDGNPAKSPSRTPSIGGRGFNPTLSHQVFHHPLNHLTMGLANSSFHYSHPQDHDEGGGWFGSIKKKVEEKLNQAPKSKGSKTSIQNYIRLFESLVIRSLKLYTVTSSMELQRHVLNLLAQLVQLRVNYNMLDSDQVFIRFIIKQFESIESGLIRNSADLVPHVFFFLVLLSYERYHSKTVISMPKIIQLCDGLLASGRDAVTHVVPAMEPIVHDLFVVRANSKQNAQESATQREVVLAMLVKLLKYPQVLSMARTVLQHGRREGSERWRALSRQVADVVLPMLDRMQIELRSHSDLSSLHFLLEALSPSSLRPTDLILDIMLSHPSSIDDTSTVHRWLAKVLALLRVLVCNVKEADVIDCMKRSDRDTSLQYLRHGAPSYQSSNGKEASDAYDPAMRLAWFFHNLIEVSTSHLSSSLTSSVPVCEEEDKLFLCRELEELLLLLTYIHRSGLFKLLTAATRRVLDSDAYVTTKSRLLEDMVLVGREFPVVTLMWGQLLVHVGHMDLGLWERLTWVAHPHGSPSNVVLTFNQRIIKSATIILLCDFVSQNQHHCDVTSWLIEHHVYDVIELCGEPPVQDFLSIIGETSSSEQFLERVMSYCKDPATIKAGHMRKLARCLSGLTDSCVGPLLTVLVSPAFIFSPVMAVSRSYDQLACNHVESLLAREHAEVTKQVPLDDIDRLLAAFSPSNRKRFARLHLLLTRLKCHVTDGAATSPPPYPAVPLAEIIRPPDKDWLKSTLAGCCSDGSWSPECAQVLACCEYDDVMAVMNDKVFLPSHLETCISRGVSEVLSAHPPHPYSDDLLSSIMKASRDRLLAYVSDITSRLPDDIREPHHVEDYDDRLDALLRHNQLDDLFDVCRCMTRFLSADQSLPSTYKLAASKQPHLLRVAVLSCEVVHWRLCHGWSPSLSVSTSCLEVTQQTLANDVMCDMFNQRPSFVARVTEAVYAVAGSYIGELPYNPPYQPPNASPPINPTTVRMAQLFELFLGDVDQHRLPSRLERPIYNLVLHLSRSSIFNSYIRIPRLLWRYGWEATPDGSSYPDIPPDYLQEKEVLSDFIAVVNRTGWVSRPQFEETWASLLGVLVSQPVVDFTATEQNEDTIEVSCLAIRGLTSLVINCSLLPHAGNTATGRYKTLPRRPPLKLHQSRAGRQLLKVRSVISEELHAITDLPAHSDTHHCLQLALTHMNEHVIDEFACNTERVMTSPWRYGPGQFSVRSFHEIHGILPLQEESEYPTDDSSTAASSEANNDDSDGSDMFEAAVKSSPLSPHGGGRSLSPFRIRDGVDVHSCVQFLLDLYAEWFRSAAQGGGGVARPLLCECVRSLLLTSDLFSERQQFEWMMSAITKLHGVQPSDDDVMLQYIVTSLCKAGAVLGMGRPICENLLPLLEAALQSSLLSCRISALHGLLYVLEEHPGKWMRPILDLAMEFIPSKLVDVSTSPSIHDEEYVVALVAVAYYVIEKCHDVVTPEFASVIIQASLLMVSAHESSTPVRVYHAVVHGLEGLVVTYSLSPHHCDALIKAASEQVQSSPTLSRALAACGLLVTCMYTGRMRMSNPNDSVGSSDATSEDALETRLLAMERVSLLFDRIRRGTSRDARAMVRILPWMLDDFFPAQDVMNKVIAEFVSTLQPYPDLVARVLHQVFQTLHSRDESKLVQEWVMLSLSNALQRSPLSTAVWCLTCLFVCASTNHWVASLLPVVAVRMKRPDPAKDWPLFCRSAVDFYACQLSDELDRRTFLSVFSSCRHEPAYKMLLDALQELNGERGILQ